MPACHIWTNLDPLNLTRISLAFSSTPKSTTTLGFPPSQPLGCGVAVSKSPKLSTLVKRGMIAPLCNGLKSAVRSEEYWV
jgi:hypothetical protein